ncbi:hypothetical protein ACLOJK_031485 [Asimina triloba]
MQPSQWILRHLRGWPCLNRVNQVAKSGTHLSRSAVFKKYECATGFIVAGIRRTNATHVLFRLGTCGATRILIFEVRLARLARQNAAMEVKCYKRRNAGRGSPAKAKNKAARFVQGLSSQHTLPNVCDFRPFRASDPSPSALCSAPESRNRKKADDLRQIRYEKLI